MSDEKPMMPSAAKDRPGFLSSAETAQDMAGDPQTQAGELPLGAPPGTQPPEMHEAAETNASMMSEPQPMTTNPAAIAGHGAGQGAGHGASDGAANNGDPTPLGASAYPFRDNPLLPEAIAAGRMPFAPALSAPASISHFATLNDTAPVEADREHLGWLCYSLSAPPPAPDATQHTIEFDQILVHWENYGPISTYTVVDRRGSGGAFTAAALDALPEDWLSGLTGIRMFGLHVYFEETNGPERNPASLARLFGRDDYIGASLAGGKARVWADWHQDDGFPKLLLRDDGLSPRQAGRLVMDLVRFEASRMAALTEHARLRRLDRQLAVWEQRLQPDSDQTAADSEAITIVRAGLLSHYRERLALSICDEYEEAARVALHAVEEGRLPGLVPLSDYLGHSMEGVHQDISQWRERFALIERELERAEARLERDDRDQLTEAIQLQTAVMARTVQAQTQNRRLFQLFGLVGLTTAFGFIARLMADGLTSLGLVESPALVSLIGLPVALLLAYALVFGTGSKRR
ncbi:MAG: DUF3422 family protein [Pseudomonadota bacterium]